MRVLFSRGGGSPTLQDFRYIPSKWNEMKFLALDWYYIQMDFQLDIIIEFKNFPPKNNNQNYTN